MNLARARRVEVTAEDCPLPGSGYASAFEVRVPGADAHTAEQWARACFEDAAPALRSFVLAGWRFVLGLRLGPRPSPDHVCGWTIVRVAPEMVVLEVRSALLTARKSLRVDDAKVVATTCVRFDRTPASALWAAVAPVHHRTEPALLGRAASTLAGRS